MKTSQWYCCECNRLNSYFAVNDVCLCGLPRCGDCVILWSATSSPCIGAEGYREPQQQTHIDDLINDGYPTWQELYMPVQSEEPMWLEDNADVSGFEQLAKELGRTHLHERLLEKPYQVKKIGRKYWRTEHATHVHDHFHSIRSEYIAADRAKDHEEPLDRYNQRAGLAEWYGFLPEEVVKSGALNKPHLLLNNLTNEIHPFFERRNWMNCSDEMYEFLKPALRLATNFITKDVVMGFWCTLLFGNRIIDHINTNNVHNAPRQRIRERVPITKERCQQIRQYFWKLATENNVITYQFRDIIRSHYNQQEGIYCFGLTEIDYQLRSQLGHLSAVSDSSGSMFKFYRKADVDMFADFAIEAQKFMDTRYVDEARKLRFFLFFACNLTHELAHAVQKIDQFHNSDKPVFLSEPYLYDHTEAECGRAWEASVFGAHLLPMNDDTSCQYGLIKMIWPHLSRTPGGSDLPEFWTVPMSYVERMQQQDVWDQNYGYEERVASAIFCIPSLDTDAISVRISGFTTMPDRDYFNVEAANDRRTAEVKYLEALIRKRVMIENEVLSDRQVAMANLIDDDKTLERSREAPAKLAELDKTMKLSVQEMVQRDLDRRIAETTRLRARYQELLQRREREKELEQRAKNEKEAAIQRAARVARIERDVADETVKSLFREEEQRRNQKVLERLEAQMEQHRAQALANVETRLNDQQRRRREEEALMAEVMEESSRMWRDARREYITQARQRVADRISKRPTLIIEIPKGQYNEGPFDGADSTTIATAIESSSVATTARRRRPSSAGESDQTRKRVRESIEPPRRYLESLKGATLRESLGRLKEQARMKTNLALAHEALSDDEAEPNEQEKETALQEYLRHIAADEGRHRIGLTGPVSISNLSHPLLTGEERQHLKARQNARFKKAVQRNLKLVEHDLERRASDIKVSMEMAEEERQKRSQESREEQAARFRERYTGHSFPFFTEGSMDNTKPVDSYVFDITAGEAEWELAERTQRDDLIREKQFQELFEAQTDGERIQIMHRHELENTARRNTDILTRIDARRGIARTRRASMSDLDPPTNT